MTIECMAEELIVGDNPAAVILTVTFHPQRSKCGKSITLGSKVVSTLLESSVTSLLTANKKN